MAGDPPLFEIGCAGFIEAWERLADGRYNLVLHGTQRFRVLREPPREGGRLYRVAEVELLARGAARSGGGRGRVRALRERVLAAAAAAPRARRAAGPRTPPAPRGARPREPSPNTLCQILGLPRRGEAGPARGARRRARRASSPRGRCSTFHLTRLPSGSGSPTRSTGPSERASRACSALERAPAAPRKRAGIGEKSSKNSRKKSNRRCDRDLTSCSRALRHPRAPRQGASRGLAGSPRNARRSGPQNEGFPSLEAASRANRPRCRPAPPRAPISALRAAANRVVYSRSVDGTVFGESPPGSPGNRRDSTKIDVSPPVDLGRRFAPAPERAAGLRARGVDPPAGGPREHGPGLELLAPSAFHRDRVAARYLATIRAPLAAEAGEALPVALTVGRERPRAARGCRARAAGAASRARRAERGAARGAARAAKRRRCPRHSCLSPTRFDDLRRRAEQRARARGRARGRARPPPRRRRRSPRGADGHRQDPPRPRAVCAEAAPRGPRRLRLGRGLHHRAPALGIRGRDTSALQAPLPRGLRPARGRGRAVLRRQGRDAARALPHPRASARGRARRWC